VLDTVGKLGWKVDVRKHVIKDVILKVLEADGVEWEEGRDVPLAREEQDCVVSTCSSFIVKLTMGVTRTVINGSLGISNMKNNRCIIYLADGLLNMYI